jgi:hypothetical protein
MPIEGIILSKMLNVEFENHVCETFGLDKGGFDRLFEEFLSHFGSTLEEYIRRRHLELQHEGTKNQEIYSLIMTEVSERRFAAEPLSLRRIRRMIYG